jgi:hypothetical protein
VTRGCGYSYFVLEAWNVQPVAGALVKCTDRTLGEMEMPNALDAYLSAVERFRQCAAPILENLTKAREAYEEALQASTEIRKILTSKDDVLGSVMVKLRDTVSQQLVPKSEPKKVIPMFPGDAEEVAGDDAEEVTGNDAEEVVALLRQSLAEGHSKLADNETDGEASAAPQESGGDIKKPAATDEKSGAEAPAEPKKKVRWL